ncbi:MAG: DNA (cytosine-5-)-methyltransferase [Flavobacteriales bacterium]|nr:DNA (cytosine-5-)-methyltransferase [Flavobacteriales bacterium]
MKKIKVVELFAGVGGFRIGLEGYPRKRNSPYEVLWSNQWEPSTKKQHASMVYQARWPECDHVNQNIEEVIEQDFDSIPDHDLLVGGFPCQDYSVATSLRNSKGLRGKKGVLWWSIEAILRKKRKKRPRYLMLENVDRLLKSPADQRGRDFAIMLRSLADLGYAVEWRVINAADYGMPQRRRRIFILAYLKGTALFTALKKTDPRTYLGSEGVMAKAFPVEKKVQLEQVELPDDILEVSQTFGVGLKQSPFGQAGLMIDGSCYTGRVQSRYRGRRVVMEDILQDLDEVGKEFWIPKTKEKDWEYQKGAKRLDRVSRNGHAYTFTEGRLTFPDPLDRPSRTIITGEGGPSPSRFKHVVEQEGVLRRLTPVELERLNMFPDDHTRSAGIRDAKRAFFMGNALVVGVVEKLGRELAKRV